MKPRRMLYLVVTFIVLIPLVALGKVYKNEDFGVIWNNPDGHVGDCVDVTAVVFNIPPSGSDVLTVYQVYVDIENREWNTLVAVDLLNIEKPTIKSGDYIHFTGRCAESYEYTGAMGGTFSIPWIWVDTIEKIAAMEAISPAFRIETFSGVQQAQEDITISLMCIEFTRKDTRIKLKITNGSSTGFAFYEHESKVVQAPNQYECLSKWEIDYDYESLPDEIFPNVTSEGYVIFKPFDDSVGHAIFYLEGWGRTKLDFKIEVRWTEEVAIEPMAWGQIKSWFK